MKKVISIILIVIISICTFFPKIVLAYDDISKSTLEDIVIDQETFMEDTEKRKFRGR